MTAEQALAAFSPTGIFEITWLTKECRWRVFYLTEIHFDYSPLGMKYRHADGDSVLDAIAQAIAQQVKERLT